MNKLASIWNSACAHASAHREAYHHCLHAGHVAYLGTVAFHGPYTLAATGCLFLLILGYAFRLEIPDAKNPSQDVNFSKLPNPPGSTHSTSPPPRLG